MFYIYIGCNPSNIMLLKKQLNYYVVDKLRIEVNHSVKLITTQNKFNFT